MITNVSLATVWVADQDSAKAFYIDKLGFREHTDVTMDNGYRWCSVVHPDHPEMQVTLAVPGPPLDDESADMMRRMMEKGALHGVGLSTDDCRKTSRSCRPRVSSSCRSRPTGPTGSRPCCATTRGTGSSSWRRSRSREGTSARAPDLLDGCHTGGVTSSTVPHLRRARDLADRCYADDLDLDVLAAEAAMSKFHFTRSFVSAYGETPMRYLTRRRIERAQDLFRGQPHGHRGVHDGRLLEPRVLLVAVP